MSATARREAEVALPRLRMDLQVASRSRTVPDARRFRRWALAALDTPADLTLRVVDRPEGERLNADFRGGDHATNVLTFVYGRNAGRLEGDIVLCAPVVRREAREQRKPLDAHYAHLTVHGVLHLQGWDHEREREALKMEARETAILRGMGYADPYLPQSPAPAAPMGGRKQRGPGRRA